jgi:hydrogenase nickel incorporation protein HypA/HybF
VHELSVASAVVATVEKHACGRPVAVVTVRLGRLRQVVPESLRFYFELVSKDTVCEGALLVEQVVPAELRCDSCAHSWELDEPLFACPECGCRKTTTLGGNELEVESIEIEEEACIART